MRTRLSICMKKKRFAAYAEALAVASKGAYPLRAYRCDRCFQFHLTHRTKGKKTPHFALGR